jgi:hypothetical protein
MIQGKGDDTRKRRRYKNKERIQGKGDDTRIRRLYKKTETILELGGVQRFSRGTGISRGHKCFGQNLRKECAHVQVCMYV